MKFLLITLIAQADPAKPTRERFREVVDNAVLGEELGFDGYGVGERHERPFISSSPPVVLSHIAAKTSRIRLWTAARATAPPSVSCSTSRPTTSGTATGRATSCSAVSGASPR